MELTNISSFSFLNDPEEDIYDLSDGISIPTYEELGKENTELQTLIDTEK